MRFASFEVFGYGPTLQRQLKCDVLVSSVTDRLWSLRTRDTVAIETERANAMSFNGNINPPPFQISISYFSSFYRLFSKSLVKS